MCFEMGHGPIDRIPQFSLNQMPSLPGIILSFALVGLSQATDLSAESLDIFETRKPFPLTLSALGDRNFDLARLKGEEIAVALNQYKIAEKQAASSEEKNLLGLAIGYLHYQNGNFSNAAQYLKTKIVGNFILEDFRLNTLAFILKDQGLQQLQSQNYPKAINSLKISEEIRINLFKNYPGSPFHANVSRDLAEIEYLLGEGYFLALNHKAAWQAYRRSLMRDFPDNAEHKTKVNLALANNYQSAGDLRNAADIYASLLKGNPSLDVKQSAIDFFRVYEIKLKNSGIDIKDLQLGKPPSINSSKKIRKPHAPRKKPKIIYNNKLVREFYESLDQDDLEETLNSGLQVLREYPGIQEARGVIKILKQLLPSYLESGSTNSVINEIADLFTPKDLNNLGYSLWKTNQTDHAAYFYEKIIELYPSEIAACHKAIFFLGRIAEDEGQYTRAVKFYDLLLKKYDFGPYTTSALFKIPWIEKLEKKYDLASAHFERLLKFYSSPAYKNLRVVYPNPNYQAAGKYWLAQTYAELGKMDKKVFWLQQLAEQHTFDFYTILTQAESGFDLNKFLTQVESREEAFRKFGMGEIDRKRLSRAEQLIAIGFSEHGVQELEKFRYQRDNPAFSFYLANLFKRGGDFQNSIKLSWKLSGNGNPKQLSRPIAEGLFPKGFMPVILDTLKDYDLDPFLILSLMRQESAFNAKVTSKANAVGLMQLIPPTAADVARALEQGIPTVEHLKDPVTNVRLGVEYLNRLLVSFNQNMVYALAAYNAGPTKVGQWVALRSTLPPLEFIESIPFTETRNYVKKILRNYAIYLTLYDAQKMDRFNRIFLVNSN